MTKKMDIYSQTPALHITPLQLALWFSISLLLMLIPGCGCSQATARLENATSHFNP